MPQIWLSPTAESVLLAVAGWLLTYLLHSGILLTLGLLLDGRAPRFRSSRVRTFLLRLCLLGGVLTATVQVTTGVGPGIDFQTQESEELVASFSDASPASSRAIQEETTVRTREKAAAQFDGRTFRHIRGGVGDPAFWLREVERGWPLFLASLWGALALLFGARTLGGLYVLHRRLRDRAPIRSNAVRARFQRQANWIELNRPVEMTSTTVLPAPVALPWGEVCLPESLVEELEPREQEAVLVHELAHIEARDPIFHVLASIVSALLFIQPLNRIALRRLQDVAESYADERVSEAGLGPELANAMLANAEMIKEGVPAPALMRERSARSINERINKLLASGTGGRKAANEPEAGGRQSLWIGGGALVLLLLFGPSAHLHKCLDFPDRTVETHFVERWREVPHVEAWSSSRVPAFGKDISSAGTTSPGAVPFPGEGNEAVHVRLEIPRGTATVRLRQGNEALRLILPGQHTQLVRRPDAQRPGSKLTNLLVRDGPSGDYLLYIPSDVSRVAVDVNGRSIAGPSYRPGSTTRLASTHLPGEFGRLSGFFVF